MTTIELTGPLVPAEVYAERSDAWRIAYALLRDSGLRLDMTPEDVLDLARFLAE